MSAAILTTVAAASSTRLLADVKALDSQEQAKAPAILRLEAALGRDFADRLVTALSHEQGH